MNFHEEYVLLNRYNRQNIIEIKFQFNAQNIRLFFTKSDQHQFLVLICETNEATVIKNMPFYDYNGYKHINGYWGTSYKYIKDYLLDENHKLTTFYQYVRKAIRIAIHDSQASSHDLNKLKVILHPLDEGLKLLKSYKNKSTNPEESIYFHHVRRVHMTDKQYAKVTKLLGKDAANYLVSMGLTAIFTSDISKQKQLVLEEST